MSSQSFKIGSYAIYRSGWNRANQSAMDGSPHTVEVCRVNAASADEAISLALESGVTCYNNQYLSTEIATVADKRAAFVKKRVRPAGSPRGRGQRGPDKGPRKKHCDSEAAGASLPD